MATLSKSKYTLFCQKINNMADKNIKGIKYSLDANKKTAIVIARKKATKAILLFLKRLCTRTLHTV